MFLLNHGFLDLHDAAVNDCSGSGDVTEDSDYVLYAVPVDAEGSLCKLNVDFLVSYGVDGFLETGSVSYYGRRTRPLSV